MIKHNRVFPSYDIENTLALASKVNLSNVFEAYKRGYEYVDLTLQLQICFDQQGATRA